MDSLVRGTRWFNGNLSEWREREGERIERIERERERKWREFV